MLVRVQQTFSSGPARRRLKCCILDGVGRDLENNSVSEVQNNPNVAF